MSAPTDTPEVDIAALVAAEMFPTEPEEVAQQEESPPLEPEAPPEVATEEPQKGFRRPDMSDVRERAAKKRAEVAKKAKAKAAKREREAVTTTPDQEPGVETPTTTPATGENPSETAPPGGIRARSLIDIPPPSSKDTLLGDRMLCRKCGMLFVAATGLGKSTLTTQQSVEWCLGRSAFGIAPSAPLKILLVQAENDDGDLYEQVQGALRGVRLSDDDVARLRENLLVHTSRGVVGEKFLAEELEPLLAHHRPDLIVVDPLLAFAAGDLSRAEVSGAFLRAGITPLLDRYNCGIILIHHVPKTTNRDTSQWRASDWSYAGAGSADMSNWARCIVVLDATATPGTHRLILAKRGKRAGWRDELDQPVLEKWICHAKDGSLRWIEADEDAVREAESATARRKPEPTQEELLEHIPLSKPIGKEILLAKWQRKGMGINRAKAALNELIADEIVHVHLVKRKGTNPMRAIARYPQEAP